MIEFQNLPNNQPYDKFKDLYISAKKLNQENIEAIAISSYDIKNKEVNSRFVNVKYILEEDWIFFTNYNSPKSNHFKDHNNISALFFWPSINVQIRLKANIKKTSMEFSDFHYQNRSMQKNALAHSSEQSKKIDSYNAVIKRYEAMLNAEESIKKRPKFWGGFKFKPYYFEFWEGHNSRLNKREAYEKVNESWNHFILQP